MFDYDPITFRDYPVCVTDYTRKQTHVVGWHCVALAEIISFTSDKHQSIGGKRSTRQLVACRLYIIIPHNFISISTPRENGFPGKSATCSKANTQDGNGGLVLKFKSNRLCAALFVKATVLAHQGVKASQSACNCLKRAAAAAATVQLSHLDKMALVKQLWVHLIHCTLSVFPLWKRMWRACLTKQSQFLLFTKTCSLKSLNQIFRCFIEGFSRVQTSFN